MGAESKKKQKDPFLVAKEIMTSEEKFIEVLKLLNEVSGPMSSTFDPT